MPGFLCVCVCVCVCVCNWSLNSSGALPLEPHPETLFFVLGSLEIGFREMFAWADLEPKSLFSK
jgi:hypothetical protein